MAKQQQSGIVAGARRLSDVQGKFQNLGSTFVDASTNAYAKDLEKKKERQKKSEENLAKANALMSGFKDDVDYLAYTAEEQAVIKNKAVGFRNEFADLANIASKINDKTSPEYQDVQDRMNMAKNKMFNLAKNTKSQKDFKVNYKADLGNYSKGGFNADAIGRGAIIAGAPISSINDFGDIVYSDENGKEFLLSEYQLPATTEAAQEAALELVDLSEKQSKASGVLDANQLKGLRVKVNNLVGSKPEIVQTFLTAGELSPFDFDDIVPSETAQQEIVDRIMNGLIDTRGSLYKDAKNSNNTSGKNKGRNNPIYTSMENLEKKYFNTPALNRALRFTADERVFTLGSKNTEVTLKNDGWYLQSKQPDGTVFYNKYTDVNDLLERNSNLFN
tara:strand:- start:3263 stop:4429 length:1167 start_codon:yes stop_codon:yes gene_type:complete